MLQETQNFNQTIVELFERQVQKTPTLIALRDNDKTYSYYELNKKVNQFANWFKKNDINQNDFVAILLEPSIDFIICILAIIKTGAIYVPLDIDAPDIRLKTITTDFKPALIITNETYKARLEDTINISLIKNIQLEAVSCPTHNLNLALDANSPIYLMYTSGSTGKPKGILVPHNAIVNLAKTDNYAIIEKGTVVGQFSNLAFDASTFEIWSSFLNGGTLSIIPPSIRTDPSQLKKFLQKQEITCLFLPTGYFHQLIKSFPKKLNSIRTLVFGGEQANPHLIRNFLNYRKINKLPIILINGYGPTEATTFTCRHSMTEASELSDEEFMCIGKPIKNVKTYILDEHGHQTSEGELYISGINLAVGYYQIEHKEQDKFALNHIEHQEPYHRIYKTGDRVKLLPSGNLLCLGRLDDQVKIGGFRIHLNEVENELMKHEAISLAAVVVEVGGGAHKMLTAYLVLSSEHTLIHANDLRAFLSLHLPPYMVPNKFVVVGELPLTSVGKVDKKNLAQLPHTDLYFHIDTSSSSLIEESIKTIWEHLLNRSNIESHTNLFELGANSLLILEACTRINNELKTDLQISQMITHPTIHRLSRFIEGTIDSPAEQEKFTSDFSDIAIIGMSCRYPNANSVQEFWENLCQGQVCLETFTKTQLDRLNNKLDDKNFVPVRGILSDIEQFDAAFFGFNPMDASITDPQQRLFLECAWEALEQASVIASKSSNISVYAGMADSTYLQENLLKNSLVQQELDRFQQRISTSIGMLSTQVSYRLNLKRQSININTACSTGLVAVAEACQALAMGRSDVALAGAASIVVPQIDGYFYRQGGIESIDGHCRPFEDRAGGTVFSNGVGVVILKRLGDALADNNTIYAVIKGVGMNNDGSDKLGYTAPSVNGQIECIRNALWQSKINPDELSYIEAHGTATPLGDVVEVEALSAVFRGQTDKKQYCALGSVKANIGHTDVSSGVAGLIKATLCLYHKKIPPMPQFETYNAHINFEESPFFVNSNLLDWEHNSSKLNAGVSSFGVGGTNVHIVLSEHVTTIATQNTVKSSLVVLSAKTEPALQQNAEKLIHFLKTSNSNSEFNSANIAYTLQTGREAFQWRCFSVGDTHEEIINNLLIYKPNYCDIDVHPNTIFMFPGQGMQYHQMATELMIEIPYFSSLMGRGASIAKAYLDVNLLEIINNPYDERLNQTQYAQPALFIIEYALANLLIHYGIIPTALIGHSLGEYVAACIAGIFTFEDAIALVCQRGFLMASACDGEMLAIECTENELLLYLENVELALHNSINYFVVAGKTTEINKLEQKLLKEKKSFRKLPVSHAFHHQSMDDIEQPFKHLFSNLTLSTPKIPMISNVTGTWISSKEATDSNYWYTHLRHTVQFCKGIENLLEDNYPLFIEVGPGQSLNGFLKDIAIHHKKKVVSTYTLPRRQSREEEYKHFLSAMGKCWQHGISINWQALHESTTCKKIPLPTYAFQKQRYWIEPDRKQNLSDGNPAFYKPLWSKQPINLYELNDAIDNFHDQTWIIFKDNLGIADQIIAFLKRKNTKPIIIEISDVYSEEQSNYFKINPFDKEHYIKVISTIRSKLCNPIVLHCFSCTKLSKAMLSDKEIDEQLGLGFYSILYLTQAYLECVGNQKILKTLIISAGSQQVVGSENLIPINASLNGPCRALSKEHSSLQCKLIDINPNDPAFSSENFLNIVFSVCLNESWVENSPTVAYRNNYRWNLAYGLAKQHQTTSRLKDGGTYLLTGGLGGIALVLCEAIAKSIKNPRFILLARNRMFPENEWDNIIQDPNHTFYEKIIQLRKLQLLGAHFIFHQADVTAFESLSQFIKNFTSTNKIDGIIHGAGISGGGLISLKSNNTIQPILLPKIHGTYNLAKVFENYPLDFVVLQSSIAAITGEPGQIDYCAANACLDAIAISNLFSTSFILSINWNTWRDTGMAVDAARIYKENFLNRGNDISSTQGQQLFLKAMQGQDNNLIVSNFDIDYYLTVENQKTNEGKTTVLKTSRQTFYTPVNYIPPSNLAEKQLAQLWQDSLGIDQIGINDDFFMLGGHSLNAINLMEKVNKHFNCNLPATQIYQAPTIKQLCLTLLNNTENLPLNNTFKLLKKKVNFPPYLFICHPISGLINCFHDFVSQSKLPMSIYGIEDPGIKTNQMLYENLISMAEDYLVKLRKIQPYGPYYLMGYSFGGNILFEVASKLIQQGQKVNLLALIDSWTIFPSGLQNENTFMEYLEDHGLSETLINLAWKREKLLVNHKLSTGNHEILLFKASQLTEAYQEVNHPTNGWSNYNKGKIICHAIPGNHDTILNVKNSIIILQVLLQYLKDKHRITNEIIENCTK